MRTKGWLVTSIVLNIITAGVLAIYISKPRALPGSETAMDTEGRTSPASRAAAAKSLPGNNVLTNAAPRLFDWRTVESGDYQEYITNLRAIGCPEETIRDIITADVNKLFEARRKEMRGASTNRFQYWKTGNPLGDLLNEDRLAKQKELSTEKRALLKELLGVNYTEKPELATAFNPYEDILDFLPAGKQNELLELEQKFAARLMSTMKDARKGDVTAMRQVQKEKEAELLKMLGPEAKEEYDLRISETAVTLRMQMGDFQPTEQEFRDIFKLQKQFNDQYSQLGNQANNAETTQARNAVQKEVKGQIRNILGEDRYLDYEYSGNFTQSSLKNIADEYQVPRGQALRVFDLQAEAQEQARMVRANNQLSREQRQLALDGIRAETEKEVGRLIGAAARDAYVQKGSWIKNLNVSR